MPKISFNAEAPKAPKLHEKVSMSLDDIAKLKNGQNGPQGGRGQQAGRGMPQAGRGQGPAGRGQAQAGRGQAGRGQPTSRSQQYAGRSQQPQQFAPEQQAKTNAHPAYAKFQRVQKSQPTGPKQHQFQQQQGPPAHARAYPSNQSKTTVVYTPVQADPSAAHRGGRGKPGLPGGGRGGGAVHCASGGRGATGKPYNPKGNQGHQYQHFQQQLHPKVAFKPHQHNGRARGHKGGAWSQQDLIAAASNPQHPLHHTLTKIVEAKLSQRTGGSRRGKGAVAVEDEDLEDILAEDEDLEEGKGGPGVEEEEEDEGSAGLGSQGGGLHGGLDSSWSGAAGEGVDEEDTEEGAEMPGGAQPDVDAMQAPLSKVTKGFIATINAQRKKQGGPPPFAPLPLSDVRLSSRQQQYHPERHNHPREVSSFPHPLPVEQMYGRGMERHSSRTRQGADLGDLDDAEFAAYSHGMRLGPMRGYHSRLDDYDDLRGLDYERMAGRSGRRPLPYSEYSDEDEYVRMRMGRGGSRNRLSISPPGQAPYLLPPPYEHGMPPRQPHRSRSRSPLRAMRSSSMHRYAAEGLPPKGSNWEQQQQQFDAQARSRVRERNARQGLRSEGERGGSREGRGVGLPAQHDAAAAEPAAAAEGGFNTGAGSGLLTSYLLTETLFPDPGPPEQELSSRSVARAAIAIEHIKSQEAGKRAVLPLWQLKRLKECMQARQLPVVIPKPQGRLELTVLGEDVVNAMCEKDPSMDVIQRGLDLIDNNNEWTCAADLVAQQLDNDDDMSQILLDVPDFTALPQEEQNKLLAYWYNDEWPKEWPEWSRKLLRRAKLSSSEEEEEEQRRS